MCLAACNGNVQHLNTEVKDFRGKLSQILRMARTTAVWFNATWVYWYSSVKIKNIAFNKTYLVNNVILMTSKILESLKSLNKLFFGINVGSVELKNFLMFARSLV